VTTTAGQLVTRVELCLLPDPSRVLARLFVPGQELVLDTESRATGVLSRILALPDDMVTSTLATVFDGFADRHRDLRGLLRTNYEQVAHRVPDPAALSDDRRLLIGACFTNEYTLEAAALFNPSAVAHPDQSGLEAGAIRFVLSLRAVGEGHISSIEFRSGVVGPGHDVRVEEPGRFLEAGGPKPATYDRALFAAKLSEAGADRESASFLTRRLTARFDDDALYAALSALAGQRVTRHGARHTDALAQRVAACNYEVAFSSDSELSERVLWPHAPSESHGMEDARFVRFVDDAGAVTYFGTYTAFDGSQVDPQLIETQDFAHFRIGQLAGPAAKNKGMALFPRKVNGQFVALSRWDRESSAIATSNDGRVWSAPTTLQSPQQPWEIIQLGNAGSPIETARGWLVLTHGCGPMRQYSLGAILLDLEEPTRVIGALREPLLSPLPDERNGYVPNVLYSCGALPYGDEILVPYGVSDSSIRFAFVDVAMLLDRLVSDGPPSRA
jgi:predicted GH43/DUF377 family glycosyl hydrolase